MRLLLLFLTLLALTGCSGEQEQEGSKKDHVLRSQIDTMNRAKEVRSLVQERLDEEAEKSEAITK